MKTKNLAAITLPVYNAMPNLVDTVKSVLNQSCRDFNFIVIDDGSTDNSFEYLSTIKDPRLKLIKQKNMGLGFTLNRLFKLADTKYILRLDADDICHKNRLEKQLYFMEANPDIVMSGTGIHFICNEAKVPSGEVIEDHDTIISKLLLKRFSICHPSIIIRRDAFNKIGGYKVKGAGEDLDFFLRMSEIGRLANINEDLLGYRLSFSSLSMRSREELHLGYDYAIACYCSRNSANPEPSYKEFSQSYNNIFRKLVNFFDELSEKLYRKSIFLKARNRYFKSKIMLSLAALFRPKTTLFRLHLLFRKKLT